MDIEPDRQSVQRAFGEALRILRQRTGMAQEKFALEARIERTYIGSLERGKRNPTLHMIYRLLPSLGVTFPQFARVFDRQLQDMMRRLKRKPEPPSN